MNNSNFESFVTDGCGRCKKFKTPECKVHTWREGILFLRALLLETELREEMKWGFPCYTFNGTTVIQLVALKSACALSFFKGAAMKDPKGKLQAPGPNSRYARYLKFETLDEVLTNEKIVKQYIKEALRIERAGIKVEVDPNELEMPEELQSRLDIDPDLAAAFDALTPGRKRSHVIHITGAKQSATRERRVDKCIPKILDAKGFNER